MSDVWNETFIPAIIFQTYFKTVANLTPSWGSSLPLSSFFFFWKISGEVSWMYHDQFHFTTSYVIILLFHLTLHNLPLWHNELWLFTQRRFRVLKIFVTEIYLVNGIFQKEAETIHKFSRSEVSTAIYFNTAICWNITPGNLVDGVQSSGGLQ